MRQAARSEDKYVPSYAELEAMLANLGGAACPGCGQDMVWNKSENIRRAITLQHNLDGSIQFLCYSCNSRHAAFPDDASFYERDENEKFCKRCSNFKSLDQFRDGMKQSITGKRPWCRPCERQYVAARQNANREKYLAYMKAWHQKRKSHV